MTTYVGGLDEPFEIPSKPPAAHYSAKTAATEVFDGCYDHGLLPQHVEVILDIGANVGAFSVWARHKWGKDVLIHAYEPNIEAANYCRRNAPYAELHVAGVTTEAIGTLYLNEEWGLSSMYDASRGVATPVAVVHPEALPPADVMKMDTEGSEANILYRYKYTKQLKALMYEYHCEEHRKVLEFICQQAGLTLAKHGSYKGYDIGQCIWVRI